MPHQRKNVGHQRRKRNNHQTRATHARDNFVLRILEKGYSLVEVFVVIAIIAILAGIIAIAYRGAQHRAAEVQVLSDIRQIQGLIEADNAVNGSYTPELSGIDATPSLGSAVQYISNAKPYPIYDSLTNNQNAQLLLKICNETALISKYSPYIDLCAFSGNNINVKGSSCTATIQGPLITSIDLKLLKLNCSLVGQLALATASVDILTKFIAQGGRFPVYMPKGNEQPSLPLPIIIQSRASAFCLQAQSSLYLDIVYSVSSMDKKITNEPCSSSLPALDINLYL